MMYDKIQHLGRGLAANTTLGFTLCCIVFATRPYSYICLSAWHYDMFHKMYCYYPLFYQIRSISYMYCTNNNNTLYKLLKYIKYGISVSKNHQSDINSKYWCIAQPYNCSNATMQHEYICTNTERKIIINVTSIISQCHNATVPNCNNAAMKCYNATKIIKQRNKIHC